MVNQPLVPASAAPSSGGFLLTVNGTGFAPDAVLDWNGSARTTIINSGSSLQAIITAQDVARGGTASVTVVNPAPGGTSNVVFFPVRQSASTVGFAVRPEFVPGSAVTGDFNNDGILDVAVGQTDSSNFAGSISIYLGRGDGTFSAPIVTSSTVAPIRLVTADINGDGNLDLFVSRPLDDDFSVYTNMFFGNGDGTLTLQAGYVNGTFEAAGDWNGDGKLDLIVGDGELEGGLSFSIVYLGDGKGGFTVSQGEIGNNVAGHPTGNPAIGDFNGDGRLDLAFPGPQLAVALGNGDGTFQEPIYYQAPSSGYAVAAADVNGDGKLDLITDGLSVLLGNGDGTFTNFGGISLGINPLTIVIGDFNGDGKLDAVVSGLDFVTERSQTVQMLLGKGDGTFQLPISFPAGSSPGSGQSLAMGDFNGDGRLDVVFGGGTNTMLLLQDSVNISANSLAFGDQGTGTVSAPQTVTVTNVGTTTLNVQSISFTGSNDFSETDNCAGGVAGGSSC
jgi:hypothetical protein